MNTASARLQHRGSRGTASLELVAGIPFLLLAAAIVIQFGILGWTIMSTEDAARAAARAASLGQDPGNAARSALPGGFEVTSITGGANSGGHAYTVTVRAPSIVPMLDLGTVSRTVEMPAIR